MADHENDAPEEWRPVPFPEYADKYHVSSYGRIRKILKTWVKASGHVAMALCKDDTVTDVLVHRLVAMTFISPPPSPYHEVGHRNGNAADNHVSNLRWVTSAENKEDNRINGTMVVGERHYRAKLTAEQVSEMRALHALGGVTTVQLGKQFGITPQHVGKIVCGKKWRHVGQDAEPTAATEVNTDDDPEEWRPVPFAEFSDAYLVSSYGRCARILKPGLSGAVPVERRYWNITLTSGKKQLQRKICRIVALAFLGPPPTPKHVVAHWNGNPQDDRVSNLRWATQSENREDSRRHGTLGIGEKAGAAKLTEAQVREIHALWAAGKHSQREIGELYGVCGGTIGDIIRGRNWGYLAVAHERRPRKGWSPSEETRAKLSTVHKGRKFSEETLAKMSAAQKGKKHTPEARAKMSAQRKGRKPSPETVKKVADALRGRKLAPEVVEAMRGRICSEETRQRISERALERIWRKRQPQED